MKTRTHKKEKVLQLVCTMNDNKVAKIVGCSREYVRQVRVVLKKANPYRNMHDCSLYEKRFEENLHEIVRLMNLCYSYKDIINILSLQMSRQMFGYHLNKYNVEHFKRTWVLQAKQLEEFRFLYRDTNSISELCKKLNISRSKAYRWRLLIESERK